MPEDAPSGHVQDVDYIPPPPKPQDFMAEDEKLRTALETRDYATFSLWLQRSEMEAKDSPVEHANVLARAARNYHAVNDTKGATELLLRAAKVVRGQDAKTEEMIVTLLEQFGGENALEALSAQLKKEAESKPAASPEQSELTIVSAKNKAIQLELIKLGSHDWKAKLEEEKRSNPEVAVFTEAERDDRIRALKEELAVVTQRRAQLMK